MTGWINDDYSPKDVSKGLISPTKITPRLAELIGVVVGDGHVTYTTRNRKEYDVSISGSKEDFEKHHKTFIIPAFKEFFNAEPYVKFRRRGRDECETVFRSKLIASFFHKKLGIPSNKRNVKTPCQIMNGTSDVRISFLRGLFDTDGHFCLKKKHRHKKYYPVVSFATISDYLFEDVKILLKSLNMRFSAFESHTKHKGYNKISVVHKIEINGRKNTALWIKIVGFRNGKYNDKIREWTEGELNSGAINSR